MKLRHETLTIKSISGELLAKLAWRDGVARVLEVKEALASTIYEIVEDGLDEWIGEGADALPRHTAPSSPEFLERIEEYLMSQFVFRIARTTECTELVHIGVRMGGMIKNVITFGAEPFVPFAFDVVEGRSSEPPSVTANVFAGNANAGVITRSRLLEN